METHLRSLVKGLSWRVIATLVTTAVVWFISGEISMALFAGLCDSLIKIGLFWGHERMWQPVTWGRENFQQKANYKKTYVMNNIPRTTLAESSSY